MSLPPQPDSHPDVGPILDSTARLESLIAALQTQIIQQQMAIAALQARNAKLERRLGLNSGNSGKSPSSDGLKKKPARTSSLRGRSGKRTGGQTGHPGKTLSCSEAPDATIDHFPESCSGCGGALTGATATGHNRTAGVRPPRTSAPDCHGTPRACLPLRELWHRNARGLS